MSEREVLGSEIEWIEDDPPWRRKVPVKRYESKVEEVGSEKVVYREREYSTDVLGKVVDGPYENFEGEPEVRYIELENGEDLVEGYLDEGEPGETDLCNLLGWS
ncbi:MAG: hypothetical protein ABEJ95_07625 [Candidatus Nanohalobium sp.]